ncbi:MAG: SDR family NAD(P)-dependent oxidoreductase [Myxococcales bacterium]|nr:SDR family NAD(P)-dependent oxidoreductase [Myxococcales bacterium]
MSKPSSKVWFVTGASSGFGREIVVAALERGERVVAAVRSPERFDLAAPELLVVKLDVTAPADVEASVRAAEARFGAIDVLVNNAGYSLVGAVEETSEGELREAMETMFFGAVALTRAVVGGMRARGRGAIVQITSMGGLTTAPGFGAYCAAKHALEGLSECMALELAPLGVQVLIVEPGAFRTALFGGRFRRMEEIAAYAPTVGPIRAYAAGNDGAQPGDPAKAAAAIVDAVETPRGLRLPLGADAVDAIRAKLASVLADVDRNDAVARATAFG